MPKPPLASDPPLFDPEPLSPREVEQLNPVQLLRYARERGVTVIAPYRGLPVIRIKPSKPISEWLRQALRRHGMAIYCLLQEERESWSMWRFFRLTREEREQVRRLARGADMSCLDVFRLLRKMADRLYGPARG
jgi:hypothetical protein